MQFNYNNISLLSLSFEFLGADRGARHIHVVI